MTLDGRTAPITGAARGIRLAIAIVPDVTLTADVEREVAIPRERWGRLDIVVKTRASPDAPIGAERSGPARRDCL